MTSFANFGASFSNISIISSYASLFSDGLRAGGPAVLIWSWPLVSLFTLFVALSLAEICSRYPHSGGLYFWTAKLWKGRVGIYVSWLTGWYNILGQFAIVASLELGLSFMLLATYSIATGLEYSPTPPAVLAVCMGFVFLHGCMTMMNVRLLTFFNTLSVFWHILGSLVITIALFVFSPKLQSPTFVFTHFDNRTGFDSVLYAALMGFLMAQYTMTGYDASAHMSEETKRADLAGPSGIFMSVVVSFFAGWPLLISLMFSIQDYDAVLNTKTGVAIAQIFLDSLGAKGAVGMMVIVMGAMFFASLAGLQTCSRTLYAFARDHAVPGSKWVARVHHHCPVVAVWVSAISSFLLVLPYLVNSTLFAAVTSVTCIAFYISYGLPIFALLLHPSCFQPGPFNLGRWSRFIGAGACLWIAFICVLFVLPKQSPITTDNMNWSILMVVLVLVFASIGWICGGGRKFAEKMNGDEVKQTTLVEDEEKAILPIK